MNMVFYFVITYTYAPESFTSIAATWKKYWPIS